MIDALIGFGLMLLLVALRFPIAFAMGVVGFGGFAYYSGGDSALAMVTSITYETGLSYGLSVVPLFVLMGNFVTRAGLSDELYSASNAFLGHKPGGLAMATVVACGGFSAVCGSSLATAATMAKVAMPPMRRFGYADSLASGAIAAGGTLGILIPPSVILVIYGIMTEQDIGKLFIAGLLPGVLGMLLYMAAVRWSVWRNPQSGPAGQRLTWIERARALRSVWAIVGLFLLVMGGIYGGVFTPTEAAGIGAAGAFFLVMVRRRLNLRTLMEVLIDSARTTAMVFSVLIGARMFTNFINVSGMPDELTSWVVSLDASPMMVVIVVMGILLVLGCVLESLSMVLLTVPVFYPLIMGLDFSGWMDPEMVLIWFGIVVVVATEISLITPPVGLNVFVLRGVLPDVSLRTIYRGVTPFWAVDILRLSLLLLIPAISLYLPGLMG